MSKKLLTLLCICFNNYLIAQEIKVIVIKPDTLYDQSKTSSICENNAGLKLYVNATDSVKRLHISGFQLEYNGAANGIFMTFYPSGMPYIKGEYLANLKTGNWYFWDEQGKLIKREVWENGKLLKTLN